MSSIFNFIKTKTYHVISKTLKNGDTQEEITIPPLEGTEITDIMLSRDKSLIGGDTGAYKITVTYTDTAETKAKKHVESVIKGSFKDVFYPDQKD
jgi:hypothetical protein